MSEISAQEALLKAKEIAARLTGADVDGTIKNTGAPNNSAVVAHASPVSNLSKGGMPDATKHAVAAGTQRIERKRKRWGSAPTAITTSSFSSNNSIKKGNTGLIKELPGLTEAKMKQFQLEISIAKSTEPSSKRVWVPTTRDRPETHFSNFLKERLPELSTRINCSDFNGDDQNVMELGGRGASAVIVYGMPLEPMHVTIKGSDAFIAAAAPRLEELLAEGERADREGPPPEESLDKKTVGDDDKYSTSALTLTRPYYQGSKAKRSQSEYRPATVAQLISGNPDVLGDAGIASGTEGNTELLEEQIRIPNGVVGFIIGRGGETISSMQARSGCKVQIQKEHELQPGQTERVITLQAVKQDSIDECRAIIESMVRDRVRSAVGIATHRSISGGGSNYYGRGGAGVGGRTDNTVAKVQEALAEGHKLVKVEVPDADVGLIIGKGGTTIKFIQETTGSSIQIPHTADNDNPSIRSISITCRTEEGAEAAKLQILNIMKNKLINHQKGNTSNYDNSMNKVAPAASVEVVIPNKDVGLCIGRQGCVIRQLQNKTNTRIDIPQHPPPGQNVRVIKVSGSSQEACDLAKVYIERIVNEQSAASIMMGLSYSTDFYIKSNNSQHHHVGGGIGYQSQYHSMQNTSSSQSSGQSSDPAWQAYYAAQAIANKQQQQQKNTVPSTSPVEDAYYEQFHRYSYYYGEDAARKYYGTWSPPVGTQNPYGVNPNGITAPPAADSGANAFPSATATTMPQSPVSKNTHQIRDSSVRKVSNLPAWMTKS